VFLNGKLEQQVYAKRVFGKGAQASNLLSQQRRWITAESDDAQASGIAYIRSQFETGNVWSHGSADDRRFNVQQLA